MQFKKYRNFNTISWVDEEPRCVEFANVSRRVNLEEPVQIPRINDYHNKAA